MVAWVGGRRLPKYNQARRPGGGRAFAASKRLKADTRCKDLLIGGKGRTLM
jgi:hypothetical protein